MSFCSDMFIFDDISINDDDLLLGLFAICIVALFSLQLISCYVVEDDTATLTMATY